MNELHCFVKFSNNSIGRHVKKIKCCYQLQINIKMVKYSFLFILMISVFSCKNKSSAIAVGYKQLVPKSVICETLNYFVNDTLISEFKYCNRFIDRSGGLFLSSEDSLKILTLDTIFTKEDVNFIFQQNSNAIFYKHGDCLKVKMLISGDTLDKIKGNEFWPEFRKRYGRGGFCIIHVPLFSKDHSTVIVKYAHYCGRLCASGRTSIYKKKGDKWVEIYCLEGWIS